MAEHVGTLLWEIRTAANWTLGKLAQQAGVSKAALSRWEAGLRQPYVTELEAVLDTLGATPAQRALALSYINAPRALRKLRQSLTVNHPGTPLTAGDLLRAMRWRGGWTQEQIAARLGIARHTLTRWELGERIPATEQIQALCYALGAREEEIIALTSGRFHEAPATVETTDWEEKEVELRRRLDSVSGSGLEELHYIQLDREVWAWALRVPAAQSLLARLRLYHAHHHRMHKRWELSLPLVRQAQETLRTAPNPPEPQDDFVPSRLAILQAVIAARGGARPAPERGIRQLSPWVGRRQVMPALQAWILSDLATYTAQTGRHDEALTLAEKACHTVRDHPSEQFLRQYDHGLMLLQMGRPAEALRVIPDPSGVVGGKEEVDALLARAEALVQVGYLPEAHDVLARANTLIEAQGLEPQRQRALALAERF